MTTNTKYSFAYYPGCTLSTTAKQLDVFARICAQKLGIELVELENWQCCGAVFPLGADEVAPKLPAIRALAQAAKSGGKLITLCSACHHVLKQVNHQAQNDKDFLNTIKTYEPDLEYSGQTEVIHYIEMLRDYVGFDAIKQQVIAPLKGQKIGAYYGCMLLRPSSVMQFDDPENPRIIEDLIKTLGATPVTYAYRNECCGGYRILQDQEQTKKMSCNILTSAMDHGAQMLLTACPLCQYSLLKQDSEMDIQYFTEILAEALGIEGGENG